MANKTLELRIRELEARVAKLELMAEHIDEGGTEETEVAEVGAQANG